ncbi:MAG: molybdopterin molybdotransferase MoeA [Rhizobiaceae bacterium]
MSNLLSVRAALERILLDVEPVESEDVAIADAAGRVLASDLAATRTQPPFPASAMDGYALRSADVKTCPARLTRIGESAAGHGYTGTIGTGECVRIFTGAPVPDGADTIAIQENATANGTAITIEKAEPAGKYIRPAGLDFSTGETLLRANQELNSSTLALAAAMNHPKVPVYRKPIVAIIATGDELVLPGHSPADDQIIASNSFGVAAIARASGANIMDLGIAQDTLVSLKKKFEQAATTNTPATKMTGAASLGADIIITLGGASVGDHDLVAQALEHRGVALNFWKLAMRPGKPVMFGVSHEDGRPRRYLGLPGNPVSSLVCALIFLRPLIRKMTGLNPDLTRLPAVLDQDLPANDQREEFMRATHIEDNGTLRVTPFGNQDSSILSLLAKATCLMIRPAHAPAASKGEPCEIILL